MPGNSDRAPALNPAAFDAFAGDYDDGFTTSRLGRWLRPRVWARLAESFSAGQHVLELACGTGEDALWLARRGVRVTATDGSAAMVGVARAKAGPAGVAVKQLSLQQIMAGALVAEAPFEGAYSNFGGLNTINNWPLLAQSLAEIIQPGGKLILVPMGPFCPWEIAWHLGHGQPKTAFRRWGKSAPAKIGTSIIPIWYPSARQFRRAFAPWFNHIRTESLGLWLPPSYLGHLVSRWPALFERLNRLEGRTAALTGGWGDHYIMVLQRHLTR